MTALIDPHRAQSLIDSPWLRAGGAAGAFLIAGITASSDDGLVLCPLRRCSGGYCPGCGLTRSAGQLIRGDLAGSWSQHPFLLLAFGQLAVLTGLWSLGSAQLRRRLSRQTTTFVVANIALLGAIWVARLATGTIPIPFG